MKTRSEAPPEYGGVKKDVVAEALDYLESKLKNLKLTVKGQEDAKKLCILKLAQERNEKFLVLFLSASHQLIEAEVTSEGTINSNTVYLRGIMEKALHHNAAALIVAHNHPSGSLTPSPADKNLTEKIKLAFEHSDIGVLDHIIVGKDQAISMAEKGLI